MALQDRHKILSQSVVKDFGRDLHARTLERMSQDRQKRICCCWRGSNKILIQEFPKESHKSYHKSTSKTWHLQDFHARTCQDLHNPQDRLTRTRTRSRKDQGRDNHFVCEPARPTCTWTSEKSHFMREFSGKMSQAKTGTTVLCKPAHLKPTWGRTILYKNL